MNEIIETSILNEKVEQSRLEDTVDLVTRARVASLAARDVGDTAISDILFLTVEQVIAVKGTEEYKKKFAEVANELIQAQIDRDEGWDAIEEKALEAVLTSLEYNRDPRFALSAAALANKAERRRTNNRGPHVVDGAKQQTNVIVLQMNKTYVTQAVESGVGGNIKVIDQPQRRSDLPSPKQVEQLLAPVQSTVRKTKSELEAAFENAGVIFQPDE